MVLDTGFNIWLIMTLYYKMWQILLRNGRTILLQNATNVYFLLQNITLLLQNATVITNEGSLLQKAKVITKCDIYYKFRQYRSYEWYTPPSAVVNQTGEAWGTSRTPLCIFMYIILYVYAFLMSF